MYHRIIKDEEEYISLFQKFIFYYPVLSYVLLIKEEGNNYIAVLLDYTYLFDIEKDEEIWRLAFFAKNRDVVNFLLQDANIETVADPKIGPIDNPFVYEWLIDHGASNLLGVVDKMHYIGFRDDLKLFNLNKDIALIEDWIDIFILRNSEKLLEKLLRENIDTLKLSLLYLFPSWIRKLIEISSLEEMKQSIKYSSKSIHPLLYLLEIKEPSSAFNRIWNLLEDFYQLNPEDLLDEATKIRLMDAIEELFEIYDYSKEKLKEAFVLFIRGTKR